MSIYKATYSRNGFFTNVGEILRPRILAEGYDLISTDEGKDVFLRSPQGPFPEWARTGTTRKLLRKFCLTTSYVRRPAKIEITFHWDMQDYTPFADEQQVFGKWCYQQAKGIFDYLSEWFDAMGSEQEPKDAGSTSHPEG